MEGTNELASPKCNIPFLANPSHIHGVGDDDHGLTGREILQYPILRRGVLFAEVASDAVERQSQPNAIQKGRIAMSPNILRTNENHSMRKTQSQGANSRPGKDEKPGNLASESNLGTDIKIRCQRDISSVEPRHEVATLRIQYFNDATLHMLYLTSELCQIELGSWNISRSDETSRLYIGRYLQRNELVVIIPYKPNVSLFSIHHDSYSSLAP